MSHEPRAVRVAVLNDYAVVIDATEAVLASHPRRFEVVADAHPPAPLRDAGGKHVDVDVVVVDPFASHDLLEQRVAGLAGAGGPRYVLLTWRTSAASLAEAFRLGLDGFLSKTITAADLCDALEAIHHGERVAALGDPTGDPSTGGWPGLELGLTHRDSEVLCLIAQGLTNHEIAIRMHLGANSLKAYIRASYRKIGVSRRPQAVVWSLGHGLVRTPA